MRAAAAVAAAENGSRNEIAAAPRTEASTVSNAETPEAKGGTAALPPGLLLYHRDDHGAITVTWRSRSAA
jgi:hypothetical protein